MWISFTPEGPPPPKKKIAVWTSPEAATHHPAVTWPLPAVSPTASSEGHQCPFPQQGRTHLLGRHWQPFLQRILPSISSEGCCHPFLQEGSTCHLCGHLRPSPQQDAAAIFLLRQRSPPQQALMAVSRHWHPSPQHSTGCHLLSKMQALVSSGGTHSLSLWCQAFGNSPSGDQQALLLTLRYRAACWVNCVPVAAGTAAWGKGCWD